ncbi:alpha/beta hydrolase [Leucobacter musarum]|uniref:alpha/beta hydrolase n=1 Tax=Leucobacter musarum TaxID=1930747 RepID=UPI0006A76C4F|nr:alpha/beta hydrolase [Leucobacter musarum]
MKTQVDSASQAMLERVREHRNGTASTTTLVEARQRSHAEDSTFSQLDFTSSRIERSFPVRDGSRLAVHEFAPAEASIGTIVYIHGGGWVYGELDFYDGFARELAIMTGCTVVMPEYRRAPEAPFPTALNDVSDFLDAYGAERVANGVTLPLVLMGDSAGGNLVAAEVQRRAREDDDLIQQQVLIYPVLDGSMSSESYRDDPGTLLLTAAGMQWFWDQYVPDIEQRTSPLASPLLDDDLLPAPPTLMMLARADVLYSEGMAYALRLAGLGTDVLLHDAPGQIHGFFTLRAPFPGARHAMAALGVEIRRRLNDEPAPPKWVAI